MPRGYPGTITHGTLSSYTHGCRCGPCRAHPRRPGDAAAKKLYRETERARELSRAWREENAERVKDYNRSHRSRRRRAALDILGGVCSRCGFGDERALQFDHTDGGGTQERKSGFGSMKVYMHVIANPADGKYQLLCANCNWIKSVENRESKGPINAKR